MNTLEIARIMGKRHDHVIRDLKAVVNNKNMIKIILRDKSTRRDTIAYEVSADDIKRLKYGESVIDKMEITKQIQDQKKHIQDHYNDVNERDKKIKQLEDALLAKDVMRRDVVADNDVLRKRNVYLEDAYKNAELFVKNAKFANC